MKFKAEYHAEPWSMEHSNGSEEVGPFRPEHTVALIGSFRFTNGRVLSVETLESGKRMYEVWWRGLSEVPLFYREDELRRVPRVGDTVDCGEWDSVDAWLEGVLPGRYTLTERVSGEQLEVTVGRSRR